MKLSKEEALFLYGILFHNTAGDGLGEHQSQALEILRELADSVLQPDVSEDLTDGIVSSDEDGGPSEEDDYSDDEDPEDYVNYDYFVTPEAAHGLKPILVISPAGDKVTLEFDVTEDDQSKVDALIDDSTVIIEGIIAVVCGADKIALYDGESYHTFGIAKKLPKQWTSFFTQGSCVGFQASGEDE